MIKKIHFNNEVKSPKSEKNPSTLNSQPVTFPDSVQSDLFNYLKPAQRKAIRPFLQIIKRPYQEKLCISLMDYLEGNGLNELHQPVLRFLQQQIIEECNLHPLTSREPKSIGTVIRQFLAGFNRESLNPQL